MRKEHISTLGLLFARPVSGSIKWKEIQSLFVALGARIDEAEGLRMSVELFGVLRVFQRPHPSPDTDKGAVESIRKWLDSNGVRP